MLTPSGAALAAIKALSTADDSTYGPIILDLFAKLPQSS